MPAIQDDDGKAVINSCTLHVPVRSINVNGLVQASLYIYIFVL